jgi:uncharacterized protein (UPF0332 family)
MHIEKAQESLRAAELCYNEKLYNSTASRAYYAMFQAAVVALEQAGLRPKGKQWSHEQLRSTFATELTRKRKLYPNHFVTFLSEALEIRHQADYRTVDVSEKQARQLLKWAREIIRTIKGGKDEAKP